MENEELLNEEPFILSLTDEEGNEVELELIVAEPLPAQYPDFDALKLYEPKLKPLKLLYPEELVVPLPSPLMVAPEMYTPVLASFTQTVMLPVVGTITSGVRQMYTDLDVLEAVMDVELLLEMYPDLLAVKQ